MAALKRFPRAHAVAVEFDPYVAILLRANLAACGLSDRCRVIVGDYRKPKLPSIVGRTLFIGNPPYLRHHGICSQWKQWYSTGLKKLGVSGSQIAGLHLHFFLKTCQLARPEDLGCFITAAEWLDSGYGSALRELLTDNLGGIAVCAADPEPGPPIVMTYMRRGPPMFARNKAGAQLLNIAHGLFPKTPLLSLSWRPSSDGSTQTSGWKMGECTPAVL
jgi:hypothetical protein